MTPRPEPGSTIARFAALRGRPADRQHVAVQVVNLQRGQFAPAGTGVGRESRQEEYLLAPMHLGQREAGPGEPAARGVGLRGTDLRDAADRVDRGV